MTRDGVMRIHLIGICGTAMATLAALLKRSAATTCRGRTRTSIRR
jgi:UDP-N-acetylmuramate-alanine ligase